MDYTVTEKVVGVFCAFSLPASGKLSRCSMRVSWDGSEINRVIGCAPSMEHARRRHVRLLEGTSPKKLPTRLSTANPSLYGLLSTSTDTLK
jgi:hypothetical protein